MKLTSRNPFRRVLSSRKRQENEYLKDCDRNELLDSIAEPEPVDSDDMSE